jgi:hypothetical protein
MESKYAKEHTCIPLQTYKYQPSGKRDIDREEDDGERYNNTRGLQEILLIHEMMMMMNILYELCLCFSRPRFVQHCHCLFILLIFKNLVA